jgi:host factor-I protein
MAEKNQNIQDVFLNRIRKEKNSVTVFLVNGVKLQGIVTWFDNFSLLLKRDSHIQLVYKHAISTIMPSGTLSLYDDEAEDSSQTGTQPPSEM